MIWQGTFAQGFCNEGDIHPERVKRYDVKKTRTLASALYRIGAPKMTLVATQGDVESSALAALEGRLK